MALLVGVVIGVWLPLPQFAVRIMLVVVWGLAAALCMRAAPIPVTMALVAGFMTGGVLLAATRYAAAIETPLVRWFASQPGAETGRVGPVLLEGRLRADAMGTDYGVALSLTVARVGRAGAMRKASGGVLLSVGGRRWSGRVAGWRAGRIVRAWATLRPPAAYRNPGVADQARRQAMRGDGLARVGEERSAHRSGPAWLADGGACRDHACVGPAGVSSDRSAGMVSGRPALSPLCSSATAPAWTTRPPAGCRMEERTTSLPSRVAIS